MTSNVLPLVKALYTLPLARPAQAKVQMLTTSSCIVKSIPWNLVNLSHLYIFSYIIGHEIGPKYLSRNMLSLCHLFFEVQSQIETGLVLFTQWLFIYRTRAIITRGLYTFNPIFEVQKRFLSSFFIKFWPYVRLVFKSRAGYSGAHTIVDKYLNFWEGQKKIGKIYQLFLNLQSNIR